MASIQVSQGFHCVRCSGMPGPRASDFVVINPFIPLLHAQFEGRPTSSSAATAPPTAASAAASFGKKPKPDKASAQGSSNSNGAETRVFVWSLRLDESRVPWSVFHSHVVGCHQWQRLEPQSVRGRLAGLFPNYHDELVELDANGGGEGGQWSFPAPFLHVSGSEGPLAAMHDRTTWLDQSSPTSDVFGAKLLATASAASVSLAAVGTATLVVNAQEPPPKLTSKVLEFWLSNPMVRLPSWATSLAAPSPLDEASAQALRLAKLQRHDANYRTYQQQQAIARKNMASAREAAAAAGAAAAVAQQDAAKAAAAAATQAKIEDDERKRNEEEAAAAQKKRDLQAAEDAKAKALASEYELPADVVSIAATIKAAYGIDLKAFEVSGSLPQPATAPLSSYDVLSF